MVGQDDTPTVVECAPERETVIRAIKILTLKSTDNENEPWNEIGTVAELLDYYLKLLDEKVQKTNDIPELRKFIEDYMIPHLPTESSDSESNTDKEEKLGYWGFRTLARNDEARSDCQYNLQSELDAPIHS